MGFEVRKSSPLSSLGARANELSCACDSLWVATAFVTDSAVNAVVTAALEVGATARLLTGVFGRVTRKRTFHSLCQLVRDAGLKCRIWNGDFHAKIYLWRLGARAVAWVGSANLTDRGLQAEGEVMLEISESWSSPVVSKLRKSFEEEWARALPLDGDFVAKYREAPRTTEFLKQDRQSRLAPIRRLMAHERKVMLVMIQS